MPGASLSLWTAPLERYGCSRCAWRVSVLHTDDQTAALYEESSRAQGCERNLAKWRKWTVKFLRRSFYYKSLNLTKTHGDLSNDWRDVTESKFAAVIGQ
jgi:hypothetical protein